MGIPRLLAKMVKKAKSKKNLDYPNTADPSVEIGQFETGKGVIIFKGAVVSTDAKFHQ